MRPSGASTRASSSSMTTLPCRWRENAVSSTESRGEGTSAISASADSMR